MIRYALNHDEELTCAFTCHIDRCHTTIPRYVARDGDYHVTCNLAVISNGQKLPAYQNPERSSARAYKVWVLPFLACMT